MRKRAVVLLLLCFMLWQGSVFAQDRIFITEIQYSPDGKYIAGIGYQALRVWDASSGDILFDHHALVDEIEVEDVSWSPDNSRIVTASSDDYARIWNITNPNYPPGTLIIEVEAFGTGSFLGSAEWSPYGEYIALGGLYEAGIRFWNPNTNEFAEDRIGGLDVGELAWSPTLDFIATRHRIYESPAIALPELNSARNSYLICTQCPSSSASALAWNSTGEKLAVGNADGTIFIVDIATNQPITAMETDGKINTVSWSFDEQLLTTVRVNVVQVWDIETATLLETLGSSYASDFSPVSYDLAYFDNNSESLVIVDMAYLVGTTCPRQLETE